MSVKQDGAYPRSASDLERKYQFGKTFSEMLGLINDSRDKVDSVESSVGVLTEQSTTLRRDMNEISFKANTTETLANSLEDRVTKTESDLSISSNAMNLRFEKVEGDIDGVDGRVSDVEEDLSTNFEFDLQGLTITAGGSKLKLRIANDKISFYNGDINEEDLTENLIGYWDGDYFYTGNILIRTEERAQFGNFAFIPRTNGSMDLKKVSD